MTTYSMKHAHATPAAKKVAVGLGGGLSSAVAAALLKSEGYDVLGVCLQRASHGLCHSEKSEEKVRAICQVLDIPLHVEDASEAYEERVIDPYVHGVLEGKRPVPCVACHSAVVLPGLERVADERGCAFFATGHFAVVGRDVATGMGRLYRASETLPDQSFWLYGSSAESLARLLTPMGALSAPMIEKLAVQFDLPEATQGVLGNTSACFAGEPRGVALIESRTPRDFRPKGAVRTLSGGIAGDHPGLHHFAPGQKFSSGNPGKKEPDLFVAGFAVESHALIVGPEQALRKREILAVESKWIRPVNELKGLKCQARFSAGGEPVGARVTLFEAGRVRVTLDSPVRAPLSGRPVVFFEENEILGGALIEQAWE